MHSAQTYIILCKHKLVFWMRLTAINHQIPQEKMFYGFVFIIIKSRSFLADTKGSAMEMFGHVCGYI